MNNTDRFFENLYKEHYSSLTKYVYNTTHNKSSTEEIVQEIFLVAYRKIDIVSNHENPVGWLYLVTKTLIKAHYRKNEFHFSLTELDETRCGRNDEYIDDLILTSSLSEDEAKLLKKHYLEGIKLSELAVECGISLSACKMRLKRAREKLFEKSYIKPSHSEATPKKIQDKEGMTVAAYK